MLARCTMLRRAVSFSPRGMKISLGSQSAAHTAFRRDILIVMAGTATAQLLPVLASPMLTRLFSPSAFGIFGLFLALCGICAIAGTARYEQAILLPAERADSLSIVALASVCLIGTCSAIALLVMLLGSTIADLFGNPAILRWLPLLPVGVFALGANQILYLWANRNREFKALSSNRIWRAACTVLVSVILGYAGFHDGGLIIGFVVGTTTTIVPFMWPLIRQDRELLTEVNWTRITTMARRYRRFAFYSLPGDTINAVSGQMPILLLGRYFPSAVVGSYSLTQRLLGAPNALVSRSVGDVFRQRASEELRSSGSCLTTWKTTARMLTLVSVVVYLPIALWARPIFVFAFGPDWAQAGRFAQLMTPYFALGFVASVLGQMSYLAEKQSLDLAWQAALSTSLLISLVVGGKLRDPGVAVVFYSTAYSLMYIVYLAMSYRFAVGVPNAERKLGQTPLT